MSRPRRVLAWLIVLLAAAAGCSGDDGAAGPDAGVDATPPPDAGPDLTGPLFDPDHVLDVRIEVAPADWDTIRHQNRSLGDLLGSCLSAPFPSPFTYVEATVTIDGQRLPRVGLRKKGFLGSLDDVKPSLRLKLDEYVADQRLAGLTSITLNNSKQDPSYVRQCLAYRTFAAAGIPAPRCNFAHVRVGGVDLGVYVHVETVGKPFLRRHFVSDAGNLYEGTLSDFRAGWTATFDLKTNEAAADRRDLDVVRAALERPDGELVAALEPVIDIDQFLTFWAAEVLVTHWDGYAGNANNFFVYDDPTSGRFHFMPWGVDATFLASDNPFGDGGARTAVQAQSLLPRRLYQLPAMRDRYLTKLRQLLATVWDEAALRAEVARMGALIRPIADPDGSRGLAGELAAVEAMIAGRRARIEQELAPGPPTWPAPLRDAPCLMPIGDLAGTFRTTWGTAGAPDPFATGTGTLTGTVLGAPVVTTAVGATAGLDTNVVPPAPPKAILADVALRPDGSAYVVAFQLDPALVAPGARPIDLQQVVAALYLYRPAGNTFELVGLIASGTLTFQQAATTPGATIVARFDGTLIRSPF